MSRLVLLALVATLLVPAGASAADCADAYSPFASIPGASLVARDHVSKDDPPVRYRMWRGTVPSFDGLPLSVDVTVPCDASGPVPLVAMSHGWGDDKTIWEETGRSDTVSSTFRRETNHLWNNIWFASKGYAVLNHTARGWHDSCGPRTPGASGPLAPAPHCLAFDYWIHMGDMRWEVRDVQWLAGALVESGVADPGRLAVTGGSYGGGPTVMNAILNDRVMCGGARQAHGVDPCAGLMPGELAPWTTPGGSRRLSWAAAVPMYTWGDVIQVLVPNGRGSDGWGVPDRDPADPIGVPIESYFAGLYASGQPLGNGYYAPPGVDPTADITLGTLRALAGNPFLHADPVAANAVHQFRSYKSAALLEPNGRVPIFWVQGFTDPLFTGLEALQVYNRLRAHDPDYPIKLFFGDIGHDYAMQPVDEWDLVKGQMNAFLDHYLADAPAPTFDVGATVTRCLDPGAPMTYVSAPDWSSIHPDTLTLTSAERGWTSHSSWGETGFATDPVSTASIPGPQSYRGCRRMSPARTDPGVASWTWELPAAVTMVGSPVVDLAFVSTAADTQLSVRLWDVAPDGSVQGLVTRGVYRSLDGPGTDLRARFQLAPTGYRFAPGHSVKVEVTGNDAPYRQASRTPAFIEVHRTELSLPTRGSA
ncbi:MAG TPA: CocE/NonD family hydrolase C-terminal non-catalytic domain-containing protein [Actinomycetota bacterium]|nr:CocE/NonD family hydrolase C-terminal non-catalytic domain-containing protein [Actinomycetota bacterium]